jgi:acyl carrier protein
MGTSMVPDIAKRVRKIIIMHLAAEETTITEDAKFIGDLGADSLDVFEVTMSFEEEFDMEIPD